MIVSAGGLGFDSRVCQIELSAANAAALFFRSCVAAVAQTFSSKDRPRHSLHASP